MESAEIPSDAELKQLREKVYSNLTDLQRRFDLGAALFRRQKYYEAIPELQKAQMGPKNRWPAMRLLIQIYDAGGRSELAARVREQLSKESGEDEDEGSAPVPMPKKPVTPHDPFRAARRPDEDDRAI